jgi:hypothetical protein
MPSAGQRSDQMEPGSSGPDHLRKPASRKQTQTYEVKSQLARLRVISAKRDRFLGGLCRINAHDGRLLEQGRRTTDLSNSRLLREDARRPTI